MNIQELLKFAPKVHFLKITTPLRSFYLHRGHSYMNVIKDCEVKYINTAEHSSLEVVVEEEV